MKKRAAIPHRFPSEAAERAWWQKTDATAVADWAQAAWTTFPNLRPSTRTISLRLPAGLIDELKALANERDVPYQSLLKIYLVERVARERGSTAFRGRTATGAAGAATSLEPVAGARRR